MVSKIGTHTFVSPACSHGTLKLPLRMRADSKSFGLAATYNRFVPVSKINPIPRRWVGRAITEQQAGIPILALRILLTVESDACSIPDVLLQ